MINVAQKHIFMLTTGEYSDYRVICHIATQSKDTLVTHISEYKRLYKKADWLIYPYDHTLTTEEVIANLRAEMGDEYSCMVEISADGNRHINTFDEWLKRKSPDDIEVLHVQELDIDIY